MLTETEIRKRLKALYDEYEPCPEDYDEWAVNVLPVYQNMLNDMGLGAYTVEGDHSTDEQLSSIALRTPWGHESTIPDPAVPGSSGEQAALEVVVAFFYTLANGIEEEMRAARARRLTTDDVAVAALEAQDCLEAACRAKEKGDTVEMFRCFKRAARFISLGMWYRPEEKA